MSEYRVETNLLGQFELYEVIDQSTYGYLTGVEDAPESWFSVIEEEESEPKTYEIESLNDILKIPSDRMPVFFKELSDSLINVRKNLERNGNEDLVNKVLVLEKTEWTDDGKEDKTFSISLQP